MNCAVRARPTITLASSSGRMRAGSAWSITPAESRQSESTEANSRVRMSDSE